MAPLLTPVPKSVHPIVKLYRISRSILAFIVLVVVSVVFYNEDHTMLWGILGFYAFVWPHIAYAIACRSKYPKKSELRNLLFDSFMCGVWIGFLYLNFWPSIALLIGVIGMTLLTGGIAFMFKGMTSLTLGYLIVASVIGFTNGGDGIMEVSLVSIVSAICMFATTSMLNYLAYRQTGVMLKLRKEVRIQKERMEGLAAKLAKYLSPQVYGSIFSGDTEVKVETYRKKLTVFFSDIEGFTALTESMESEELTSLLNTYLNEMSNIAIKHGGTIDKYIGDSIMIFFGDPETRGVKEDAIACVSMALEMKECMRRLKGEWISQGITKPLQIRIGINTGYCTVGNFGSEDRLDYTIIGNQVNLASRLENNANTDEILISHETYMLVEDVIECNANTPITVKGVAKPVQTYSVINLRAINEVERINQDIEGFSLSVDLSRIEKDEVAVYLKEALASLG